MYYISSSYGCIHKSQGPVFVSCAYLDTWTFSVVFLSNSSGQLSSFVRGYDSFKSLTKLPISLLTLAWPIGIPMPQKHFHNALWVCLLLMKHLVYFRGVYILLHVPSYDASIDGVDMWLLLCCFEDGDVDGAPLWSLIYFCLRCGDPRAAQGAVKLIPWVVYFSPAWFSLSILRCMVRVFFLLNLWPKCKR